MGQRREGNSGFTLIEIMIVLAIIAAVLAIGGIRLLDKSGGYRAQVQKMASLVRSIRNNARLNNCTCRLALVLDDEKGHTYGVECAPGNALLPSEAQLEAEKKVSELLKEKKKSAFVPDPRILKHVERLPRGLFFGPVEYADRSKPIVSGPAYIYFFPQGLVEEAVIHFTNRKTLNWTIALNPLTGRPDVFERERLLKDLRTEQ